MKDPCSDPDKYAPVLQRMVELLGEKDSKMTFGDAMKRAARELHLPVPPHMEEPLFISALQVIAGGRIPGAPDA